MRTSRKRLILGIVALAALTAADAPDGFRPNAAEQERLALYSRPESWFLQNLSGPRAVVEGHALDPKLQYYFEQRQKRSPEQVKRGLDLLAKGDPGIRAVLARDWALLTKTTAPMRQVEDRAVAGRGGSIPIRIYTPQTETPGPLPTLVYFHGGGWLYSSIEAVDRFARLLAHEGRMIVVSVDYRLAPQHKWPASGDDGEDAFRWVRANAAAIGSAPELVGVGGDSAGGYISMAISRRQLAANRPAPAMQLLYYTAVDFERSYASFRLFGKGYGLDLAFRDYMMPLAFGDRAAVQRATREQGSGSMTGMPATIVVTAGFDILRDSGRALARRLERDGVAATYLNYPTLAHGFLQFSAVIPEAERASVDSARLYSTAVRSRAEMLQAKLR